MPWTTLETWSPTAFLVGGGLFVVFTAILGADAFTGMTLRGVQEAFGAGGWALAFVGLLGLYPSIADDAPWLSRVAAAVLGLGAVGATATAIEGFAGLAGLTGPPPSWFVALNAPIILGILVGFTAVGVAVLRTGARSRRLAVLILSPAAVFLVNFVRVPVLGAWTPPWAPFVLGAGQALALLSIGYVLWTAGRRSDVATPAADSAT